MAVYAAGNAPINAYNYIDFPISNKLATEGAPLNHGTLSNNFPKL